jgi:predicted RND superfamily exporter protein
MASWTDRIPTFNPYVEQQPVDAMLKVGMYKQQKYEEGVQKIQTAIDNVAGLDIASELDKKYLQSKLNGLGNNLNIVAGADFSNFQLVNSVNGMTKEIVKDEYVQNAVASTAQIRKNQRILEADEKAGKSSVQNRAKFEEGVGNYINKIHFKR